MVAALTAALVSKNNAAAHLASQEYTVKTE
jgi:hypothetical protein